jgi:hypothetical protein
MKICFSLITSFALLATQAHSESFTLEVSGSPETAPIYVLEGTATTTFLVDGSIDVSQNLTYSMDSAAKGIVQTTGAMTIKRELQTDGETYYLSEWDAKLSADSEYRIKNYRDLILVEFNHRLNSDNGTQQMIDGEEYTSAVISSIGRMWLIDEGDSYMFEGLMKGTVRGFDENNNIVYENKYKVVFEQEIGNMTSKDGWGSWSGSYDIEQTGRKLEGEGTLKIGGSTIDPVDTITQNIKGSYNSKKDIFSWNAAGSEVADKKVTVKITHNGSDELIDGKNRIRAAAQNRKF